MHLEKRLRSKSQIWRFGEQRYILRHRTNHKKHSLYTVLVAEFINSVWSACQSAWSAVHMPQVLVPVRQPVALVGGRQLGRDPWESFANKHQAVVGEEVGSTSRQCTQSRTWLNENLTELCTFQWEWTRSLKFVKLCQNHRKETVANKAISSGRVNILLYFIFIYCIKYIWNQCWLFQSGNTALYREGGVRLTVVRFWRIWRSSLADFLRKHSTQWKWQVAFF